MTPHISLALWSQCMLNGNNWATVKTFCAAAKKCLPLLSDLLSKEKEHHSLVLELDQKPLISANSNIKPDGQRFFRLFWRLLCWLLTASMEMYNRKALLLREDVLMAQWLCISHAPSIFFLCYVGINECMAHTHYSYHHHNFSSLGYSRKEEGERRVISGRRISLLDHMDYNGYT